MIKRIDIKNPVILDQIITLQRASYLIEAEMIDFYEIPPLIETKAELLQCRESFYGYFTEDRLVGLLSYTVDKQILDICRIAVHPDYFRKGIADALLSQALTLPDIKKALVATGQKNLPAVRLYQKHGFIQTGSKEIGEGIYIVEFEFSLNR